MRAGGMWLCVCSCEGTAEREARSARCFGWGARGKRGFGDGERECLAPRAIQFLLKV